MSQADIFLLYVAMQDKSFSNCYRFIFTLIILLILFSCGGEDNEIQTVTVPSDLQLDTLEFDQHPLEFDRDKTGPYDLEVGWEVESIGFTATNSGSNAELQYQVTNSSHDINPHSFTSGEKVEFDLEEGENLLRIYVYDMDSTIYILYTITITRASESAQLNGLAFFDLNTEEQLALTPNFSPDVYAYTLNLDYNNCSYDLRYKSRTPDNEIMIDGEDVSDTNRYLGNLDIGENYINLFIYSGEEVQDSSETKRREERYSILVSRAEPSEDEENKNANLRNLRVENHSFDFLCSSNTYIINVNNNTDRLKITAESEVDGVEMLYQGQDLENQVPMEIELEADTSVVALSVKSLDGTVEKTYQILLNRLNTNRVMVESVEELQHALRNAKPNDEIRIKPGEYAGLASLETSGSEVAAFFSPQSGSRLLPITLTSDDPDEDVVLKVQTESEAREENLDILRISGNYWLISNLRFTTGDTAINIDKSDYVTIDNVDIYDVNFSGINLSGNNNLIVDSRITLEESSPQNNIEPATIRVAGDADTRLIASNNQISRNQLRSVQSGPVVVLNAFSENTDLRNNEITHLTSSQNNTFPLLQVKANNSTIRFNHFSPSGSASNAIAFQAQSFSLPVGDSTEESNWGNQANVYQNTLDRAYSGLPFILENSAQQIVAGENYLSWLEHDEDTHDSVSYEGSAIEPQSELSPTFRISPSESPEDCLSLLESEDVDDFYFISLKPCGDTSEFYWSFEFSSNHYIYIKSLAIDDEEQYLTATPSFISLCSSPATATSFTYLDNNLLGFSQQWAVYSNNDNQYWFANKFDTDFALTVGGNTYGTDTPIAVCGFTSNERQKFILKP